MCAVYRQSKAFVRMRFLAAITAAMMAALSEAESGTREFPDLWITLNFSIWIKFWANSIKVSYILAMGPNISPWKETALEREHISTGTLPLIFLLSCYYIQFRVSISGTFFFIPRKPFPPLEFWRNMFRIFSESYSALHYWEKEIVVRLSKLLRCNCQG